MTDNELIAEFMGSEIHPTERCAYRHPFEQCYVTKDGLDYNKSWDWLMPVVEKISEVCENAPYKMRLDIRDYWNEAEADIRIFRESKEVTYQESVKFIKWYKETTDQTVQ